MQSYRRSAIETGVATVITGLVAAAMNYWLMPVTWTLPPTVRDSLEMAVVYGVVSWALKFIIRRVANALER